MNESMNKRQLPEGWFSPADIETYRRLVSAVPDGGTIAELGVWRGRSLCSVADLILAKKLTVYAVDSFAGTEPQYAEGLSREGEVQRQFLAALEEFGLTPYVTICKMTTDEAAEKLSEKLDLVFVDADHRYAQVRRDIENWSAKLKAGGTIAGHDYDEVEAAVRDSFGNACAVDGRIWIVKSKPYVFLTQPRHTQNAAWASAFSMAMASAGGVGGCKVAYHPCQMSLLTANFNSAWATCLNDRAKYGFTHFAMIHSDVIPLPLGSAWLDRMVEILEAHDADLLSAVVPIKNNKGLTSTALDNPENPWVVRRLTLEEIWEYPETFTEKNLLLNTGLWVCRLGDWCQDVYFRQHDRMFRHEGRLIAGTIPEDWDFSRQLHKRGLKLFATREIAVQHELEMFHTREPWGTWKRDEDWFDFLASLRGPSPIAAAVDGIRAADEMAEFTDKALVAAGGAA